MGHRTIAAMSERVKVAVIGVGNNISALVQGIALSRTTGSLDGVRRPTIDGIGVGDVDFVAAFATPAAPGTLSTGGSPTL